MFLKIIASVNATNLQFRLADVYLFFPLEKKKALGLYSNERLSLGVDLISNQSFIIISAARMCTIPSAVTLTHRRRGRSKHAALISFLLPKLINNSWVTIVGGASSLAGRGKGRGAAPCDHLCEQGSPCFPSKKNKQEGGNRILRSICVGVGWGGRCLDDSLSRRLPQYPPL